MHIAHLHLKALNNVTSLADDDPTVTKLKNKQYIDYKITPEEWELLEIVIKVLMVCSSFIILYIYSIS
jgi:hypothetical protein